MKIQQELDEQEVKIIQRMHQIVDVGMNDRVHNLNELFGDLSIEELLLISYFFNAVNNDIIDFILDSRLE